MAMINIQQGWIFLEEPHTASRAVRAALAQVGGVSFNGNPHCTLAHITLVPAEQPTSIAPDCIGDYKVIATVRNPFDWVTTKWQRSGTPRDFKFWCLDFVRRRKLKPSFGLESTADQFLYYEHLSEDLEKTFGRDLNLGYDPTHKTSGKKPWQDYYQSEPELVKTLMAYWLPYLQKYGYQMDASKISVAINPDVRASMVKPVSFEHPWSQK